LKLLHADPGRIPARLAPAIPLVLAPAAARQQAGYTVVATITTEATIYGSLQASPGGLRRHSGGPEARVEPGTRYLALSHPRWRSLQDAYAETARLVEEALDIEIHGGRARDGTVIAVGRTAGRPYAEIYTPGDPTPILEALQPTATVELDPLLLEEPARHLARDDWRDPLPGPPNIHATITTSQGFQVGFTGYAEDGFILWTHPDMTISAYPPGQARVLAKQLSQIAPSPTAAFHLANTWAGLLETHGATPEEILQAALQYMLKAEEHAGTP